MLRFSRILVSSSRLGGVPTIRGLNIPVSAVVDMVADGLDISAMRRVYPELESEDVSEALRFAALAVMERSSYFSMETH